MEDTLKTIDEDLTKMNFVLTKLKEKRNEVVYEKMVVKCDQILNRISEVSNNPENKHETGRLLSFLRRLLSICTVLVSYRDYLNNTKDNNIVEIKEQTKENIKSLNYKNTDNKAA